MKPIFLLLIGSFLSLPALAQEKETSEIEALKIAFITKKLDLKTAEAQSFWTVYNKYEAIEDDLDKNMHCNVYGKLDILETLSAEEAEEILQNYMNLRQQECELRKTYVSALKKVISAKRILMLKKAEYDFHRKLLEKYRSGDKK